MLWIAVVWTKETVWHDVREKNYCPGWEFNPGCPASSQSVLTELFNFWPKEARIMIPFQGNFKY
jgi:hypothetical protein